MKKLLIIALLFLSGCGPVLAQLNRTSLNNDVTSNIYSNGVHLITGPLLQARMLNQNNSQVNLISDTLLLDVRRFSVFGVYTPGMGVLYGDTLFMDSIMHIASAWNRNHFVKIASKVTATPPGTPYYSVQYNNSGAFGGANDILVKSFTCNTCTHAFWMMEYDSLAAATGINGHGGFLDFWDNTEGSGRGGTFWYDDGGVGNCEYIGMDSAAKILLINARGALLIQNANGGIFMNTSYTLFTYGPGTTPPTNALTINNSQGDTYVTHSGGGVRNTYLTNYVWIVDAATGFKYRVTTSKLTADRVDTVQNKNGTFAFLTDITGNGIYDSSLVKYGTAVWSSTSKPTLTAISPGTINYVLTSTGTASYPSWQALPAIPTDSTDVGTPPIYVTKTLFKRTISIKQAAIDSLGTIISGIWHGSIITKGYLADSILIAGSNISLTRSSSGITIANTYSAVSDSGIVGSSSITVTHAKPRVLSINSSWVGQSAITTLGTITSGVWTGSKIYSKYLNVTDSLANVNTIVDSTGYYNNSHLGTGAPYLAVKASQSLTVTSKVITMNVQSGAVGYVTLVSGDGADTLLLTHAVDGGIYTILVTQPPSGSTVKFFGSLKTATNPQWYIAGQGIISSTNPPSISTTLGYVDKVTISIINGLYYVDYGVHYK